MTAALSLHVQRTTRNTIGDAFHRAARKFGGKDALLFQQRRWTYAELDQAANRVANSLLALGLCRGDRVAAYGKNSDAYAILRLACVRAGLIHVPINFALTEGELTYIVAQSGAKGLFYDQAMAEHVDAVRLDIPCTVYGTLQGGAEVDVLQLACGDGESSEPAVEVDDHDVAQLLYTSGTTAAHRRRSCLQP